MTIETDDRAVPRQLHGILLMAAAMLTVPMVDGIAKYLSADHSPLFLGWARYATASLVVVPFALLRARQARPGRELRVFPRRNRSMHLIRTLFLVSAMTCYFYSISLIPLATAAIVSFIGPVIAVLIAVPLLKEKLTATKLLSLCLGFGGALIMLNPGGTIGASVDPGILLALGAGTFFAFYLIATRQASQGSDPVATLVFQCVVGTIVLTPLAVANWSMPSQADIPFLLMLGTISCLSHVMSIAAFRHAEASVLAPLVYLELIGAAAIGFFVFGDFPTGQSLVGATLIVGAGLVLTRRRRV
ncbi:DMT family transporter [Rhodospirillaceae bacterium KN72]|uniref:DMT family transporter n=1 Tax=Pacificispira spongiicola TaxID=2729598 RepID=A0A7Y0E026_9PROT|nr:DMT family transporter [Pacificispira spongiicola]NMM44762.1 DMT family transporter [Pacificispira spongiicola]